LKKSTILIIGTDDPPPRKKFGNTYPGTIEMNRILKLCLSRFQHDRFFMLEAKIILGVLLFL
jgi:hypothetical protein